MLDPAQRYGMLMPIHLVKQQKLWTPVCSPAITDCTAALLLALLQGILSCMCLASRVLTPVQCCRVPNLIALFKSTRTPCLMQSTSSSPVHQVSKRSVKAGVHPHPTAYQWHGNSLLSPFINAGQLAGPLLCMLLQMLGLLAAVIM